MKSRVSFCNWAVIRKDITRFVPLWAIYFIGGMLVMLTELSGSGFEFAADNLAGTLAPLAVINFVYAGLCAQVVFGDLFNTRLCNALHAMPLRRETWFFSHCISGIAFSVVPHVVAALVFMPMLEVFWTVALLWLLGMLLEYLFFFGLAVLSIMCTGNRVAMTAVYAMINFASMLALWLIETLYMPLLYGVQITTAAFSWLCPVVKMVSYTDLIQAVIADPFMEPTQYFVALGEGWWYLAACAVIGIGLLAAALALYRRRRLECAGDFIALKVLEPVFAVMFTLCVGCVLALVQQLFSEDYILFMCVGLVVGWFASRMLLTRSVKVFQWKNFLKLGILGAVLGGSLLLTWIDPAGIVRWIPDAGQVSCVELFQGESSDYWSADYLKFTEQEDIQTALQAHRLLQSTRQEEGRRFTIRYTLTDGRTVSRTYRVQRGKTWDYLESLYRDPQQLLDYTDWDSYVNQVAIHLEQGYLDNLCTEYVYASGGYETKEEFKIAIQELTGQMRRSLLEALAQDYREGLLPQAFVTDKEYKLLVRLQMPDGGKYVSRYLTVYTGSKHTMAWFEEYAYVISMKPDQK